MRNIEYITKTFVMTEVANPQIKYTKRCTMIVFLCQTLENRREEARAYSNLGSAYHSQRDFDKAISYHTRVLELAQEQADRAIEMRAYAGLGHAARCMQVGSEASGKQVQFKY